MLYEEVLRRASTLKHNEILMVFNSSPALLNPTRLYDCLDKIITQFNKRFSAKAVVAYSSLSSYKEEVHSFMNTFHDVDWPVFNDDFFPFAPHINEWFTGVYSTRSGFKREIREFTMFTTAANQLLSFNSIQAYYKQNPTDSPEARIASTQKNLINTAQDLLVTQSILVSNEVVTGTFSDGTAQDYRKFKKDALSRSVPVVAGIIEKQLSDMGLNITKLDYCVINSADKVNLGCPVLGNVNQTSTLVVYNPSLVVVKNLEIAANRLPMNGSEYYTVSLWNYEKQIWELLTLELICRNPLGTVC